MRKTEAMAEATSKKQEASSIWVQIGRGAVTPPFRLEGDRLFVKCSISKKSNWRISYFASAKAEMLIKANFFFALRLND